MTIAPGSGAQRREEERRAYLLDTNIVSDAIRPVPSPATAAWFADREDDELFVSAFTLGEVWRGVLEAVPGSRRRRALEAWYAGPGGPPALFAGRVLAFGERAAGEWARLMAEGTAVGRPRSALDMILAATAAANGLVVATANERHFRDCGVPWINPAVGPA